MTPPEPSVDPDQTHDQVPNQSAQDQPDTIDPNSPSLDATGPFLPSPIPNAPTIPGYLITGLIGKGGMGRVYSGLDLSLEREVAIKTLLPGANADRFVTESKISARLPHPAIPPVHALGTLADGMPYLTMKLIRGRTLAELLTERKSPSDRQQSFLQIFEQITQAIGFAHNRGILHRDLKPLNVMVGEFGEVQVMDWGLAKDLKCHDDERKGHSEAQDDLGQTLAGTILGTPGYMSPEQARGEPVDTRTDVFALGSILAMILTGQPAFVGQSPYEILDLAAAGDTGDVLTRLDSCEADDELVRLAKRCLAVKIEDRPTDGFQVASAVAEYQAQLAERTRQAEVQVHRSEVQAQEERKRRRVLFWSACTALAILIAGVIGTTIGIFRANAAAELERQANQHAQDQKTKADLAKEDALKRLKQIEKGVESFAAMITDLDPSVERIGGDPVHVQLRKNAEKLASDLDGDSIGDPLVVARLQTLLGHAIKQLGNSQFAVLILQKAHATRIRELGEDHEDTLTTAHFLASGYYQTGKFTEAQQLTETILSHQLSRLGRQHHETLTTLNNLGNITFALGKHLESIKLYEESRAGQLKNQGGVENEGTLISLGNIASAHEDLGQTAEAIRLYEQALPVWLRLRGKNHFQTASVHHGLGKCYWNVGRFREAVELLEQARDNFERIRGATSGLHLDALFWLGRAYWDNDKLPLSIQTFELLRDLQVRKFGADSPETLLTLDYLACGYRAAGRWSEAQSYSEQFMETLLKNPLPRTKNQTYTKDGILVVVGRNHLSFELAGDVGKAENWQRQWITCIRANYKSTDTLDFAEELADLCRILLKQKKWTEAEPVLRECLQIREQQAPDAWVTFLTSLQLGGALLGQKKYADAESFLRSGRVGLLRRLPLVPDSDRKHINDIFNLILRLYEEKGDREEVAKWQKELGQDASVQSNSPDRKAAQWVISQGGSVSTTSGHPPATKEADLPGTSFRLTRISLDGSPIRDEDLARFKDCTEITEFGLARTSITDAAMSSLDGLRLNVLRLADTKITGTGLAHLKSAKGLTWLIMINTPTTDDCLKHISQFKKLVHLNLYNTKVTDAGLIHLKGLNDLVDLTLGATAITDTGLKHLKEMKGLRSLWLHQNPITDAGLEHLKECPALCSLTLLAIPLTDKGLIHLREIKNLTHLDLGWTRVTDAGLISLPLGLTTLGLDNDAITDEGLAHLKRMNNLKELTLTRTGVTPKGIEDLQMALPECKIIYSDSEGKKVIFQSMRNKQGK